MNIGGMYIWVVLLVVYSVICITTLYTIISEKRDPVRTLSWIVVIILLPFVGFVCYVTFGQNYRKNKLFNRKVSTDIKHIDHIISRQIYKVNSPLLTKRAEVEQNKDIITLLLNNNKSTITYNNKTTILNNGDETFPEIVRSLKKAKHFIHLEYYMIQSDMIGCQIADILCEKASKGIEVRLIYDDVGSWSLSKKYVNMLERSGVEVVSFMPVVFPLLTSKINYRNHRKIIIIDGNVGFTGGLNIANKYLFGTKKHGEWRDTHVKIEGRAVHSLQAVFITDWYFTTGIRLDHHYYFPSVHGTSNETVQIASSGPDSRWASIMQAFFMAISHAKKNIYISTPYFIPTESILEALKVASLGGVEVHLIIPNRSDSKIIYWATRSYITELLEAGVNVYLYEKGFNHSKVMTIDSSISSIGSANMDSRSFEDNFEISAIIYDRVRTEELEGYIKNDISYSRKVDLEKWLHRSKKERTLEAICRITSPLL